MTDLHQINQVIIQEKNPSFISLKTLNDLFKKKKIRLLNKMNTLIIKIIKLSPNAKDFYNPPITKHESLEELRTRAKKMRVLEKIKSIIQEKFKSWSSIFSSERRINLYAKQFKEVKAQISEIDEKLTNQKFKQSSNPLNQKIMEVISDINKELKKAIPHTRLKHRLFL